MSDATVKVSFELIPEAQGEEESRKIDVTISGPILGQVEKWRTEKADDGLERNAEEIEGDIIFYTALPHEDSNSVETFFAWNRGGEIGTLVTFTGGVKPTITLEGQGRIDLAAESPWPGFGCPEGVLPLFGQRLDSAPFAGDPLALWLDETGGEEAQFAMVRFAQGEWSIDVQVE